MIPAVMAALEAGDFTQAKTLLDDLPQEQPQVLLCWAWLFEKQQQWDAAETKYREVLRQDCGPKITLRARQGLERIATTRKQQQAAALQTVTQAPGSDQRGVLVLEAISNPEVKTELARHFARVMHLEPYAARTLLPSRGWRFFRTGTLGELSVYGQELQACGVPLFWLPLEPISQITVIQVRYLQALSPKVQVCWQGTGDRSEIELFEFSWAEVSQRVEGLLPIFETVVDRDARGKTVYKEQIQDHAQCCDLHLPQRNTILRFYRGGYQFNQGIDLSPPQASPIAADQETSWANWRQLTALFNQACGQTKIWQDFTAFAETMVDQTEFLGKIDPQINLFRREESPWDAAFQLYSGLIFQLGQR